jgi:hypothetical protein
VSLRRFLILLCCGALGGCAHLSAPAGWDCRAVIERDGVRANAWQHLNPGGKVQLTQAEWWLHPAPQEMPRFGTEWDANDGELDWNSGRVQLIYRVGALSPGHAHRIELHGDGRRLLHGAFDRAPFLLLTGKWQDFSKAAGAGGSQLVIVAESGSVLLRRPFNASLLHRGISMAGDALRSVSIQSRDFRRQCERAPEIIAT